MRCRLLILHASITLHGFAIHSRRLDSRRRISVHYCTIRAIWKRWRIVDVCCNDNSQSVIDFNLLNLSGTYDYNCPYRYVMIAHYSIYARIYKKVWIVTMIAFCWVFSYGFQLPTLFKVWGKISLN